MSKTQTTHCTQNCQENLMIELKNQISFFKSEMASKDEIVRMLLKDNQLHNKNDEIDNTFKVVKNPIKNKNSKPQNKGNIVTKNRYSPLENDAQDITPRQTPAPQNHPNPPNSRNSNYHTVNRTETNEVIYIVGDSMLKNINPMKMRMRNLLPKNKKVIVHAHRGATIEDIGDHINPIIRKSPNKVIIHCGTNDLCSNLPPNKIAENIIKLGLSLNLPGESFVISSIVPRGDDLKGKAAQVNSELMLECQKRNMAYVSHDNINSEIHLNQSNLHTTALGSKIIAKNFVNIFKN